MVGKKFDGLKERRTVKHSMEKRRKFIFLIPSFYLRLFNVCFEIFLLLLIIYVEINN